MEIAFKIRQELIEHLNFIRLTNIIIPKNTAFGMLNPAVKESLDATESFINCANDEMLINLGPIILNALQPILETSKNNFSPKKELNEISKAFSDLLNNETNLFSYGIPFHFLDTYIDTSKFLDPSTPYQARIGTGYHAGNFSLEEMYFLDDGFFFLIAAERELDLLLNFREKQNLTRKEANTNIDFYNSARNINLNICSYSRNAIVNLYSFVECLVNSVGYDFYLRNKNNLTIEEHKTLQGINNKGGYLSLEKKLEKFPKITRKDNKQVLFITDSKQIKDPFLTFFNDIKNIRNSAMHYSPNKEAIWRKPTNWVKIAKAYSKITINVSQLFWEACYQNKNYPFYLRELNYSNCHSGAKNRYIETENHKIKSQISKKEDK